MTRPMVFPIYIEGLDSRVGRCDECHCLVLESDETAHQQWHATLSTAPIERGSAADDWNYEA